MKKILIAYLLSTSLILQVSAANTTSSSPTTINLPVTTGEQACKKENMYRGSLNSLKTYTKNVTKNTVSGEMGTDSVTTTYEFKGGYYKYNNAIYYSQITSVKSDEMLGKEYPFNTKTISIDVYKYHCGTKKNTKITTESLGSYRAAFSDINWVKGGIISVKVGQDGTGIQGERLVLESNGKVYDINTFKNIEKVKTLLASEKYKTLSASYPSFSIAGPMRVTMTVQGIDEKSLIEMNMYRKEVTKITTISTVRSQK